MDVDFYRDAVLEMVLVEGRIPREVSELRCYLFLRAANSIFGRSSEVLQPFPSCFYDFVTKEQQYDDLKQCIIEIPKFSEINESTSLPEKAWELLHWTLTNPLKINIVKKSEVSEYLTDELRDETKLQTIPYPSVDCSRFKISHPSEINSTKVFLKHKITFGSFFAYHGSPAHNFHSIIHRGLRCSLNTRKAYGPGTYLTSFLKTATSYSKQCGGFGDGIRYCVAIVEVIKHPSIKVVNFSGKTPETLESFNFEDTSSKHNRYYVVNSDDLMRLKHLLVFY